MVPIDIRWMLRRDMYDIVDIERASFTSPWSVEEFVECLRKKNNIGIVAEHNKRVVSFLIYGLYDKYIEITNVATHPIYRNQGIATALITKIIDKLHPQRRTSIKINIAESNLSTQLFFQHLDFIAIDILSNTDNKEDMYCLQYVQKQHKLSI